MQGVRPILATAFGVTVCLAGPAFADPDLNTLEAELRRLESVVQAQQQQIKHQQAEIDAQARQLEDSSVATAPEARLAEMVGRGEPAGPPPAASIAALPVPSGPVGQPSPDKDKPVDIAAVPVEASVLTPRGHFVLEADADFERYSSNRLVFQGVEIVPGLQLGVIEANSAAANAYVATGVARYGLLNHLEVELRLPFLDTTERVSVVQQRGDTVTRTLNLRGSNIGDVEGTLRYQFNSGSAGRPIFLGSFRVKSDTGVDPYSVHYDSFGVAQSLPTGTGTWAVGPGLTVLYPTDPVVLFGSLSYLQPFSKDENKTIATLHVGLVKPGYTTEGAFGFGFALNPKFSVSTGLKYDYIEGTSVALNGTRQRSDSLQVGVVLLSMAYRLNNRMSLNINSELGVTSDAPDFRCVFRIPIAF